MENELPGALELLASLPFKNHVPIIGITGPPGAGKSTVVNACIHELLQQNKRIAVLAVDPSSPFNFGSLLGDRVRMDAHFNHKNVFIRSVASRGHLGGLSTRIYEMVDVLANSNFDYIFIETVGVGQSEVEIAGVADITTVVLVPEAGDEIQAMKSGVMEIADVFVVNKSDRAGATRFASNLEKMVHVQDMDAEVIKTVATKMEGITTLINAFEKQHSSNQKQTKKAFLMAQRAWSLMAARLLKPYSYKNILTEIEQGLSQTNFNLYRYIEEKIK